METILEAEVLCNQTPIGARSGFSYKCGVCSKVLARSGPHPKCTGKASDTVLFHRETGLRGADAEEKLRLYKSQRMSE